MDLEEEELIVFTCRTCLTASCSELEFFDLSSVMLESRTYLECLNFCTNLKATTTDNLPSHICANCCESLQVAYDFIKKSKCSDELLRTIAIDEKDTIQHVNKICIQVPVVIKTFYLLNVDEDCYCRCQCYRNLL